MTRQQESFRALINNYDMVGDLAETAADSTGSASERMEVYLDSVEAKTNELKATWEEFVMDLSQSESYKGLLDMLIGLIQNMPTVIGYLKSILAIVIAIKAQKISEGINGIGRSIKESWTNLTTLCVQLKVYTQLKQKENLVKMQAIMADKTLNDEKKKEIITSTLVKMKIKEETAALVANKIAEEGVVKRS